MFIADVDKVGQRGYNNCGSIKEMFLVLELMN
jgi:hypothetical protein